MKNPILEGFEQAHLELPRVVIASQRELGEEVPV